MKCLRILILLASWGVGCAEITQQDIEDYEANIENWQSSLIEDYDFDYQTNSSSVSDQAYESLMNIKVRQGNITTVAYSPSSDFWLDPIPDDFLRRSIDDVFAVIAAAIEMGERARTRILVSYDNVYSYPVQTEIYTDRVHNETIEIPFFLQQFSTLSKREAFEEGRALWNSFGPMQNYDFQYQVSCFCGEETTQLMDVKVRNGVVDDITYAEALMDPYDPYTPNIEAGDPTPIGYSAPTINSQFSMIESILEAEEQQSEHQYDYWVATYDSTFGYPSFLQVDPARFAFDEQYSESISNLCEATQGQIVYEENRNLWKNHGAFGTSFVDYDLQYRDSSSAFSGSQAFGQLMDVKVRGGVVVEVTFFLTTEIANRGDPAPEDFVQRTIDDVFDEIAAAFSLKDSLEDLRVTYDSGLNYPAETYIQTQGGVLNFSVEAFIDKTSIQTKDTAFQESRALWNLFGPVRDYDFQYRVERSTVPRDTQLMDVKVRDDRVDEITYAETTEYANKGDPAPRGYPKRTIEEVLRAIAVSIEDQDNIFFCFATFDSTFGYPTFFYVNPKNVLDDVESTYISNFNADMDFLQYAQFFGAWTSSGYSNYEFQYQASSLSTETDREYEQLMNVVVQGGAIASVTYALNSQYARVGDPAPDDFVARTIDDVFALIAGVIETEDGPNLFVDYNREFNFPESTDINGNADYLFISIFNFAEQGSFTLSVEGEQPKPLETGPVQIGTVLTEVSGDNVEVTIDVTEFADDCCLKETHICNYPMERMFNTSGTCEKATRYSFSMSEMHNFVCDDFGDIGDTFQLDGHATVLCSEPLENAEGSPDGEGWCYGSMYWINFVCA